MFKNCMEMAGLLRFVAVGVEAIIVHGGGIADIAQHFCNKYEILTIKVGQGKEAWVVSLLIWGAMFASVFAVMRVCLLASSVSPTHLARCPHLEVCKETKVLRMAFCEGAGAASRRCRRELMQQYRSLMMSPQVPSKFETRRLCRALGATALVRLVSLAPLCRKSFVVKY